MNNSEQSKELQHYRNMADQTNHISDLSKIPNKSHFAVLYPKSITYDSGYGERGDLTTTYLVYIAFDSEEALNYWILKETEKPNYKKNFKVIYVSPVEVKISTNVTILK